MNSPTRFNRIEPLSMNGEPYAELSRTGFCIHMHLENDSLETFSVGEARKLYEWLGRALPAKETAK